MAAPVSDNFDDNSFDSGVWETTELDPYSATTISLDETNQRLEFELVSVGYTTYCDYYVYQDNIDTSFDVSIKVSNFYGHTWVGGQTDRFGIYIKDKTTNVYYYNTIKQPSAGNYSISDNNDSVSLPVYLRIVYDKISYTNMYSTNGTDWTTTTSDTIFADSCDVGIYISSKVFDTTVSGSVDYFSYQATPSGIARGIECYNTFGQTTFSSLKYKSARYIDSRLISGSAGSGHYDIPVGNATYVNSSDFVVQANRLSTDGYPMDVYIASTYTVSGTRYVRVNYEPGSSGTFSDPSSTPVTPTVDTWVTVITQ